MVVRRKRMLKGKAMVRGDAEQLSKESAAAAAAAAKSLQSCPTLCDPIDGSPQTWYVSHPKNHVFSLPITG